MKVTTYRHGPKDIEIADLLFVRNIIPVLEVPKDAQAFGKVQTKSDFVYTVEAGDELRQLADEERKTPLSILKSPGNWSIYFAGEKASGPLQLYKSELRDGVQSAFRLGKIAIPVSNTPEDVAKVIKDAGGQVREILPPLENTLWASVIRDFEWDFFPEPGA
ncbi:hypothetical protein [Agrobacterium tumefaciens]|uniref:hypothetical protein n=1 Tax=Agrobacterium tumefaciens TaxID=358 RepID=UPI00287D2009|nr:hypothetical protein [Agrobacterium tumefaciens]MDS7597478.1 hypothetical protein [Agrobacterium tumefaciens]